MLTRCYTGRQAGCEPPYLSEAEVPVLEPTVQGGAGGEAEGKRNRQGGGYLEEAETGRGGDGVCEEPRGTTREDYCER